jgi:membrane protein
VRPLRLLGSALAKFWRDEGLFLASGIAFQVLLSLIPLTLLVFSLAGSYLFSHERVMEQFGRYLEQAAPTLDAHLRRNLVAVVAHRRATGIVGTVSLLWIATAIFGCLRMALNKIFEVPRARGALHGLGFDLAMIVLSGAAFLASMVLTAVIEYLRHAPALFPAFRERLLSGALAYFFPFLVVFLICFLIYYLVPNRRGSARASLQGALFATILWEAAKHLFAWYVSAFGKGFSLVYGSLSAMAVLLVWTYYSAVVLLLGAEVAALLEKKPAAAPDAAGPA